MDESSPYNTRSKTPGGRRESDEFGMHDWSDRDIALYAVRSISTHEAKCAQRWGVIVKLGWGCLTGIGLITINQVSQIVGQLHIVAK